MNFTPLNLFNFQPLGDDCRKRGKLEMAIREVRIDLSKTAYETLGEPAKIQIGTEAGYIAIWADEDGFNVSKARGSGCSINGKDKVQRLQERIQKLQSINFGTHYIILSEPVNEDGKLIYNAENLRVCQRQQRRTA